MRATDRLSLRQPRKERGRYAEGRAASTGLGGGWGQIDHSPAFPAKAGIQSLDYRSSETVWVPAYAGKTEGVGGNYKHKHRNVTDLQSLFKRSSSPIDILSVELGVSIPCQQESPRTADQFDFINSVITKNPLKKTQKTPKTEIKTKFPPITTPETIKINPKNSQIKNPISNIIRDLVFGILLLW